ncbi:hypothetical protein DFA_02097 [Cavenderia fasciculata]|uniref:F-box domain-containing protein n=1 Tax=Cavenderia fasciculata TaxID=261658 RepID=F4PYP4_CACFS|nr:uncharacterized protein DFA_02097 [Cavenderia fasciculata]EGG19310.1 hypothetical protein DFA_02097 [Cavenderia fasciculata]|eukprot:XP_004357581.1 hypothetical protein DFA_02097 [Cavenderia fasciculata]
MLTIQVQSNIIRLLCNQNKVKLVELFYLASVSKQIRNTVKKCVGRRFKLRFNPFTESIQDYRLHIDNPLCLFDQVHRIVSSTKYQKECHIATNIEYVESNLEWFHSSFINSIESIQTEDEHGDAHQWFNLMFNQPRHIKLSRKEEGEGGGEGLLLPNLQKLEIYPFNYKPDHISQFLQQAIRNSKKETKEEDSSTITCLDISPEYFQHLKQLIIHTGTSITVNRKEMVIKVLESCKELERLEIILNEQMKPMEYIAPFEAIPKTITSLAITFGGQFYNPRDIPYNLLPKTLTTLQLPDEYLGQKCINYLSSSQVTKIESPIRLDDETINLTSTKLTNIVVDIGYHHFVNLKDKLPTTIKKLKLMYPTPSKDIITNCHLPSLTSLVLVHSSNRSGFTGNFSWDEMTDLVKTNPLVRKIRLSIFSSIYTKFDDLTSDEIHPLLHFIGKIGSKFQRLIIESIKPTFHSSLNDIYLDYLKDKNHSKNNNNNNNNNSPPPTLQLIQKEHLSIFINTNNYNIII